MGMMSEFRDFAMKGNVVDMAVGVVIGGAFGKIVTSFTNDILMPPVGLLLGGVDFSDLKVMLKEAVGETASISINYGSFLSTNSFDKHAIKGGYNWKTEKYKISFNMGVDNVTNKLFWEHFQSAPAPGRSIVFGLTTELFNLLGK